MEAGDDLPLKKPCQRKKVTLLCKNNQRLYLPEESCYAFDVTKTTYDLSDFDEAAVIDFFQSGPSTSSTSTSVGNKIAETWSSEKRHYGYDVDADTLTIRPALEDEEVARAARDFAVMNAKLEWQQQQEEFPGARFATRTPGGMKVHLPRADHASEIVETTKEKTPVAAAAAAPTSTTTATKPPRRKRKKRETSDPPLGRPKETTTTTTAPSTSSSLNNNDPGEKRSRRMTLTADRVRSEPVDSTCIACCKCEFRAPIEDVLSLSRHLILAHREKIFVCPACPGVGVYYYLPGTLRRHILNRHKMMDLESNLQDQMAMMQQGIVSSSPTKKARNSGSGKDKGYGDDFVSGKEERPRKLKEKSKVWIPESGGERGAETEGDVTFFKCEFCDQLLESRADLDWHRSEKHLAHLSDPLAVSSQEEVQVKTEEDKKTMPEDLFQRVIIPGKRIELLCLICFNCFASEDDLNSHWATHKF